MDIAIVSIILGIFGLVIAVVLNKQTAAAIKAEDQRVKQLMEQGKKETQELIKEIHQDTRQMIERMDQRHAEATNFISSLIYEEGDKARELVRQIVRKVA